MSALESPRRSCRGIAWLSLLLLPLVLACAGARDRPDVVLIVLDTVRFESVSIYGNGRDTTPALDAFARTATLFERAYAQAPWTLPSHASLFTGLYPCQHLAVHESYSLAAEHETLAEALSAEGYETAAFVANPNLDPELGLVQGFEHYVPVWRGAGADSQRRPPDEGARQIGREVRDWLEGRATGRPFFLFANYMEAHRPYSPPRGYQPKLPGARPRDIKRATGLRYVDHYAGVEPFTSEDFQRAEALYESEVRYQDAQLGELLAWLEEGGYLDNALVIITSDHGEHFGEHDGLVGHQFSVFEETLRVPLVVRFPDGHEAGGRRPLPVELIDLHATVLDLAGVERHSMGRSLHEPSPARPVFAEYYRPISKLQKLADSHPEFDASHLDRRLRVILERDTKLIWASDGEVDLFDLAADPWEQTDLADARPDAVEELARRLRRWLARHASPELEQLDGRTPARIEDSELLESLQALGYVG